MKCPRAKAAATTLLTGLALGLTFFTLSTSGTWGKVAEADPGTTVSVRVDPSSQDCASVTVGQQFDIELYISDVTELMAWDIYFVYDDSVINVIDRDVRQFQALNSSDPLTDIFDLSDATPDNTAPYEVSAFDQGLPDSGSGILAILTLQAVGPGYSHANLIWPTFKDTYNHVITVSISDAVIAVDQLDSDGDDVADICDPDADSDDDGTANPYDPDDDDDTFSDEREYFAGTDPLADCTSDGWPPPGSPGSHDAFPPDNNMDAWINVQDIVKFKPHILTEYGDPDYDRRYDYNKDLWINVLDIIKMKPFIMQYCKEVP